MTKKHFIAAASLVRAIRDGLWTMELPSWATYNGYPTAVDGPIEVSTEMDGNLSPAYVRAVWTAEAFILLAQQFNPRFDRSEERRVG